MISIRRYDQRDMERRWGVFIVYASNGETYGEGRTPRQAYSEAFSQLPSKVSIERGEIFDAEFDTELISIQKQSRF